MNLLQKKRRNKILIHWILSCILILLIPCISITVNYLFSRNIIGRQINTSNETVLNNIRHTIDVKLQSIMNLNQLLLLDNGIRSLVKSFDKDSFWDEAQNCYTKLNNYNYVYTDLNIMIYVPLRNYMITNTTANYPASIFNTMTYSKHPAITLKQWESLLDKDYSRGIFFISPYLSYQSFGKDSLIYACTSPFTYKDESKYNILVSTPCDFLSSSLKDSRNSSFFILDGDGTILWESGGGRGRQHLSRIFQSDSGPDGRVKLLNEGNYIYSFIHSGVTNWTYLISTPSDLYLNNALLVRNVTLLSTILSFTVGLFFIIITQRKNYKPVRKIIKKIPAGSMLPTGNEFELIEQYYNSLHKENLNMKRKIGSFSETAREIYFLSKLKGRDFHLSENDIVESLDLECRNKSFAIVSVYMDTDAESEKDCMTHFALLSFAIYNIMDDILNRAFHYYKVTDGLFHVFIFLIGKEEEELWNLESSRYFDCLYNFFTEKFNIELSITMGETFRNTDHMSSHYMDILNAFEYSHIAGEKGIIKVSELTKINAGAMEARMEFNRRIKIAMVQKKLDDAINLTSHFFSGQTMTELSFMKGRYLIFSLANSLVVNFNRYNTSFDQEALDFHLKHLLLCEDKLSLQNEFLSLLCFFCGAKTASGDMMESTLIQKIKDYVNKNYSDCNMNIASIASAMNLTPKYMSKLFRDENSEGLLTYINTVRINHAKELLKSSTYNMDEISVMAGFSNSRSFRRNFFKITGITPKEYRNPLPIIPS